MYGVVTSLLIHSLNSIMKVFATAIELVFIAVLSWIFLGYSITWQTMISVCIVSCSVVVYVKHPVKKNVTKSVSKHDNLNVTNV